MEFNKKHIFKKRHHNLKIEQRKERLDKPLGVTESPGDTSSTIREGDDEERLEGELTAGGPQSSHLYVAAGDQPGDLSKSTSSEDLINRA